MVPSQLVSTWFAMRARLSAFYREMTATLVRLRMTEWLVRRTERLRGARARAIAGWLAVFFVLAWFQGDAVLASLRGGLNLHHVNDDSLQQIPPFFRYTDSGVFHDDYIVDYYLACYPLGYKGLYAFGALVGVDPTVLCHWLPHLQWFITAICVALVAHKLGGRLAALGAMALVLGSTLYVVRITGGLPRGFAYPIVAATLVSLAYDRVWWCGACVLLGALFYPIVGVVAGLSLAGLLFTPKYVGLSERAWSFGRRVGFLAGTAALAIALLLPSTIAARRFGDVIRPAQVKEFPEIGERGRYKGNSHPPFEGFFVSLPDAIDRGLLGGAPAWSETTRRWLMGRRNRGTTEKISAVFDMLTILTIVGGVGLLLKQPTARRLLLLGVGSGVGYTVARFVAPFAYLPERYVAYTAPLLATIAVTTCVAGLFPAGFEAGPRRWMRTASIGAFIAVLLLLLGGRPSPRAGNFVNLRAKKELFDYIRALPPNVVIAGWPRGTVNEIPLATRRSVLLSHEVHQAFHEGYAKEMRKRMRALIDAYFATSLKPIIRLQKEFGVTHLLVDRSHFGSRAPKYFRPYDQWITKARDAADKKPYALLEQLEAAGVVSFESEVLLDLQRLERRRE